MAYVIRSNIDVPPQAPPLQANQTHSEQHGSVEAKLVMRASHTHALYCDDNMAVYYHLEEVTHGTTYAASIKPFQPCKDGQGAWNALMTQYAGCDKGEVEIKHQDDLLHTCQWKGQLNFPLEGFIAQH